MKILTYLFITFAFISAASAQTIVKSIPARSWYMAAGHRDILYMSDKEAALPVRVKENSAVVMLNEQGEEKWRAPIDGFVMGAGKFNGNILALYNKQQNTNKIEVEISEIFAMLISPEGKILQDKSILQPDKSSYFTYEMHHTDDGEFKQLMLRYSRWSFGKGKNVDVEKVQTKNIRLYSISKELQAEEITEFGVNQDVYYMGSMVVPNNDFIMFWLNKSTDMVVEQFREGSVNMRLTVPLGLGKNSGLTFQTTSNKTGSALLCAFHFSNQKHIIKTALVDFENRDVKTADEELTKSYREKIEDEAEVVGSKKNLPPNSFDDLRPVGVEFYNDKFIVVKEVRGLNSSNAAFSGAVLVTVLNNDLTVQKNFLLDKMYMSGIRVPAISYKIQDDKLRMVSNNVKINPGWLVYGEIDLKKLKWTKISSVKTSRNTENSGLAIEHNAVVWFKDHVIVPQTAASRDVSYWLQLVAFNQ